MKQKIEGGWEERFDKEFTCIVTYEKWSDEDEASKLREPQYLWQDFVKHNPKPIKSFISNLLASERQRCVEDCFDWIWKCWGLDLGNLDRAKKHFLDQAKHNLEQLK